MRKAKKCTKIYDARAQPLFCSLIFLFGDVLAAVAKLTNKISTEATYTLGVRPGSQSLKLLRVLLLAPHGRLVHRRFPSESCPFGLGCSKAVNANLGLKVNRMINFSSIEMFLTD